MYPEWEQLLLQDSLLDPWVPDSHGHRFPVPFRQSPLLCPQGPQSFLTPIFLTEKKMSPELPTRAISTWPDVEVCVSSHTLMFTAQCLVLTAHPC